MDWSNERYVRLYTRNTMTWKLLKWEGQTVLLHVMRILDRAGALDLAGGSAYDAVEALTDLPSEIVKIGLDRCIEKGVFILSETSLLMLNFLDAQEAIQSDRQRAAESRGRRRDKINSKSVTKRDGESQNVTESHASVDGVTKCHSEPSVPSLTKDICPTIQKHVGAVGRKPPDHTLPINGIRVGTGVRKPNQNKTELWNFWKRVMRKTEMHVLDTKRDAAMTRALKNHTLIEMKKAIIGCRNSPFHQGENDRHTKYNDIEIVCRDEKHFSDFVRLYKPGDEKDYGEDYTNTDARGEALVSGARPQGRIGEVGKETCDSMVESRELENPPGT